MKLFKADFNVLKDKVHFDEVTLMLYKEAISQADQTVAVEFPSEPIIERSYVKKVDGRYTDEYLNILQEYDVTSWLYERAFRKLAFAFKMTGDIKYLRKFEEAVERCLQNPFWGPKDSEYDHCSSRLLRALCVSLTWLGDAVSRDKWDKICARMKKEVLGFFDKYRRMGDDYPIGPNDHQSKDLSGAGCAAWFLMVHEPGLKKYFDRFTYLFKEKLIDETIGEDGGWPDGWGCVLYAFMDVISFLEAIEDTTGEDLTEHPRMQRTCDFVLSNISLHKNASYPYIHTLFWLAAAYRRKDMQLVIKNSVLNGTADMDYSEYAFILYDEQLKARESCEKGVSFTRSVGWGRLGWGTNADSIYLWLKSGSTDAFDRNNQNGLLLTAFGKQLFSDVVLPKVGYQKLWNCVYEEGLWTTKCSTALLVNGQNQLRNRYGEDWGPIMKFHNPNREKWGDEDAWWYDFEEPKAPYGRIVSARYTEDTATITGRADGCYGTLLKGYTRTCTMTRDGLIVIIDTLLPGEEARDFQFRANTAYTFSIKDRNRAAITAEEVHSDIIFLYDGDYEISVDEWAFNPGSGNYLTGSFSFSGPKARLITVMRPNCDQKEHKLDARIEGQQILVNFDGRLYSFGLDNSLE